MPLPIIPSSSLNPMSFTENQHGNVVLERLRNQRDTGRFCDVVLVVQGRLFPAHRNILAAGSPYFDSILKMNKVVKEQVTVNCLNPDIFELLLNYMYSGSVVIDRSNVMELLKLSNNFLVTKLKNYCAEYLDRYLDPSNCLKVKDLAQKYNMPGLVKNACLFLETNVGRVLLESLDILDWPLPKIETLFTDPNYEISPEVWLRFIARWVDAHPLERESSFKQLLSLISLAQIHTPSLTDILDQEPLFQKSETCRFAIFQAMYESSIPLGKYEAQYQTLLAKHSGEVNIYFNTAAETGSEDAENGHGSIAAAYPNLNGSAEGTLSSEGTVTPSPDLRSPLVPPLSTPSSVTILLNPPASSSSENSMAKTNGTDSNGFPIHPGLKGASTASHLVTQSGTRIIIKEEAVDEPLETGPMDPSSQGPSHPSHDQGLRDLELNEQGLGEDPSPSTSTAPVNPTRPVVPPLKLKLKLPNSAVLLTRKKILGKHKLLGQRKAYGLFNNGIKRRGRPPKLRVPNPEDGELFSDEPIEMRNGDCSAEGGDGVKAEVLFKCPHCVYSSSCQSRIQAHIEKAHSRNRSFVCNLCSFQCRWNREYYLHMKQHFQGPPFKCDTCDYSAERIQMLLTHRMKHTDERPYRCTQCDYRCRTKTNLVAHMRSHTGEKPFSCPECGRGFAIKSTLDQHLATHSDIRPFRCDQCNFSTKYQSHLISHKRIHTGDVFHCQFADCDYSSPKKSQLAAHLRTHLAVRAHTCKLCKRSFIEKSHLVRHERIHLDEKPFKCEHCEYASSRRDKLKEHIQKHHGATASGRGPYKRRYRRAKQFPPRRTGEGSSRGLHSSSQSECGASEASEPGMGSASGFRPITPMSGDGMTPGPPYDINNLLSPSPLLSRPSSAIFPAGSHIMQPSPALSLNFNLDVGIDPSPSVNKDVLLSTQVAPTPTPGNLSPHSVGASLQGQPFQPAAGTPTAELLQRPMSLPPLGGQPNPNWSQLSEFSFTAMF